MTVKAPERILAIKLADLGDLLITEPALRSLRVAYPRARIDVLTTPAAAGLVPYLGGSYNVVTFSKHDFDTARALFRPGQTFRLTSFGRELRRSRYDAVAIFHHLTTPMGAIKFRALALATGAKKIAGLDNGRGDFLTHPALDLGFGARHTVEYMLEVSTQLGGSPVDPRPALRGARQQGFITGELPERYAAVFPTTGPFAPGRNWPAASFAGLARLLESEDLTPVILGASDACDVARTILKEVSGAIDLTGRTSLSDVIDVVRNAQVTITGDSFPGHLADAVGTPLVSIFGPSNHRTWGPYGAAIAGKADTSKTIIVRHDVPCSPCLYTGYRLGRPNGCPVRTCLHSITPNTVMAAVRAVIGGNP